MSSEFQSVVHSSHARQDSANLQIEEIRCAAHQSALEILAAARISPGWQQARTPAPHSAPHPDLRAHCARSDLVPPAGSAPSAHTRTLTRMLTHIASVSRMFARLVPWAHAVSWVSAVPPCSTYARCSPLVRSCMPRCGAPRPFRVMVAQLVGRSVAEEQCGGAAGVGCRTQGAQRAAGARGRRAQEQAGDCRQP